jgi:predicted glycoside hydrolase/deacetylase ChbG (UPF0249 family)
MCHPGYPIAQKDSADGGLAREREAEVLALTAPEVKEILGSLEIRLISFRDLEANVC